MYKPVFSIVTSFFGEGEFYVKRLYFDIIKQKVNWEWIVTDDFSGDHNTERYLTELSLLDNRVKYVSQNFKREMFRDPQRFAAGKFVFHIDADDRVHPSYLLHCEYWFKRFPSVICILSGSEWIKENGVFHRFAFNRNSEIGITYNFLGRVWRNGFDFKFKEIFSNLDDIIRCNDAFIVKSLETVGDILCLPRAYIRYQVRNNSNSNVQRTIEEQVKIEKCGEEFSCWSSNKKLESPYEPYFFDTESDVKGFLGIEWESSYGTIQYVGKELPSYKKRKVRELFQDFEIEFGEILGNNAPDFKIIDCSTGFQKFSTSWKKTIILFRKDDKKTHDFYSGELIKTGKIFRWIDLWEYRWIITIG